MFFLFYKSRVFDMIREEVDHPPCYSLLDPFNGGRCLYVLKEATEDEESDGEAF